MKYQEFRTWAEKQGWLLLQEGGLRGRLGEVWLTPAGQAVGVKVFEGKADIGVYTYDSDQWLGTGPR